MAPLKQMTATQVERLVGRRSAEVCGEQSRSGNTDSLVKRIAWRSSSRVGGRTSSATFKRRPPQAVR